MMPVLIVTHNDVHANGHTYRVWCKPRFYLELAGDMYARFSTYAEAMEARSHVVSSLRTAD